MTVDEISLASIAISIARHRALARRARRPSSRARETLRATRTGRRFRGEDAAELVEHPVLGRVETLQMFFEAAGHVA